MSSVLFYCCKYFGVVSDFGLARNVGVNNVFEDTDNYSLFIMTDQYSNVTLLLKYLDVI